MTLGERLAARFKELKLTQTQVAEQTGITQAAINKYIKNRTKPAFDNVLKLAKVLEVSPAWFFLEAESFATNSEPSSASTPRDNLHRGTVITFPRSRKITRGTTFVIGHYFPMQYLPPPSQSLYAGVVNNFYTLIFNGLLESSPSDNGLHAALAIDWKPMKSSWLFRLRGGVQFHDGKPLTAEDVVWSYEQYLKDNSQEHLIQRVGIVDESVVVVQLKSQSPLSSVTMPRIMPKGMSESPKQWIGTGPFQAAILDPGFWKLKANSFYFLGKPFFDEVHIREYSDPQALEQALISGEVHFAIGVDVPKEDFVTKVEADLQRYHLHFLDLRSHPVVSNYSFRQAIALGLDRGRLAQAAGLREPLFSAGPFDYLLGDRSQKELFPPDPQKAKQLLRQVENLKDFVFRVRCYTNYLEERSLEATLVEQLNDLGIQTEVGDPPSALLVTRNTKFFENECRLWQTDSPDAYNFNGYSNPEVDHLIQQCLNSGTTAPQLKKLREFIQKDLPDIPLFYHGIPLTYVKQLGALEGRLTLSSCLNEIHNWHLEQGLTTDGPPTRDRLKEEKEGRKASNQ